MPPVTLRVFVSALVVVGGCAPALDWREVQHPTAGIVAVFPCRPQHHRRSVMVQQTAVPMHLMACSAAGQTFGISYIDVASIEAVEPALATLQAAAIEHIKPIHVVSRPLDVAGATPLPNSTVSSMDGTAADGGRLHVEVGVFANGLRVYQATTFASEADRNAIESFFAGIQVR